MARRGVQSAEVPRRRRAVARGVAVGEDLAVGEKDPVPKPVGGGHGRGHGALARGAEVGGVAERVDVARRGHQPVPVPAGVGHDGHRGTGTAADARAGPGKVGVTEGEDATVGGHHEVAVVVDGRHHAHNGRVEAVREARSGGMEPEAGYGPVELGVAVAEDSRRRRRRASSRRGRRRHNADHGSLQVQAPGRPVELGLTEGEDPAVGADQPVAARARHVGVGERRAKPVRMRSVPPRR